ncbi:MAG: sigma-70 family RNA polymerase sigma factor [Pirellulaceae bacterium]|jgi:RNA polymerase sigma-70 factor (ECF subfamily)|nr:sigma-70 family RNA polymerase sigma factor [Pirellulaceae bacterium]
MDKDERFTTVLESNQDRIYRICCCYIGDEHERQDVFQEVLLQLWKGLDSFAGRSAISTWIYRVTVNVCLGHLRLAQRRVRLINRAAADGTSAARITSAASTPPWSDDELPRLYACIRQLPLPDKTLVSLFLEDVNTSDMAEVLGISETNVRVKLHRIKQRLKQLWEKQDHGF